MTTPVSLKLQDPIFQKTEENLQYIKIPRNKYFNKAIQKMNTAMERKILKEKLRQESTRNSKSSLSVLKEFEDVDIIFE